jgi:uncharacterized damage-inducible protein DinB
MNTLINLLLKEMEHEAVTTRKMLTIAPVDKFDWKPHPKSMSLKQLVTHVAELPSWVALTINTDELDFATTPYEPVQIASTDELLAYYEKCLADGKAALEAINDNKLLTEKWVMRSGDDIYLDDIRYEMVRSTYCQTVHHRAQLGVFLRLLNIPIPGSYGPSADEQAAMAN